MSSLKELPDFLLHAPLSSLKELCLVKVGVMLWANGDVRSKPREKIDKLSDLFSTDLMEDLKVVAVNVSLDLGGTLARLNLQRDDFLRTCRANANKILWTSAREFNFENLLPVFLEDKDVPMFEKYNAACNLCQEDVIKGFHVGMKDLQKLAPDSIRGDSMVRVWTALVDGRQAVLDSFDKEWSEALTFNENAFICGWFKDNTKATEYFWGQMDDEEKLHTTESILDNSSIMTDDYQEVPKSVWRLFGTEVAAAILENHPLFVMSPFMDWRYRQEFPMVAKFFAPFLSSDDKGYVFQLICEQLKNYPINGKCQRFEFFLNDQKVFKHNREDFSRYLKSLHHLARINSEKYLWNFLAHVETRKIQIPGDSWSRYEYAAKIMLHKNKPRSLKRLIAISSLNTEQALKLIFQIRKERDENCPDMEIKNELTELISIVRKRCNIVL